MVFESTTGVKVGDPVEFTSQLLSVEERIAVNLSYTRPKTLFGL